MDKLEHQTPVPTTQAHHSDAHTDTRTHAEKGSYEAHQRRIKADVDSKIDSSGVGVDKSTREKEYHKAGL